MPHPAFAAGNTAVVTGGASGIGLASARHFAAQGMNVVVVDRRADLLGAAESALMEAGAAGVMASGADASDPDALAALDGEVAERFGGTDLLMLNAGIQPGSALFGPASAWEDVLRVNLWGPIHGARTFAPRMIERGRAGAIVVTGSKQGITTPPGDPAYNVAKSGVKTFTEALAHELRNTEGCKVTAHLLIPGFVFTDLTRGDRREKPAGAWTPEQTADFFIESLNRGDFYILCPDNDVPRSLDEKRMAWAMGDIIENRPPLSRWHPDHAEAFAAWAKGG